MLPSTAAGPRSPAPRGCSAVDPDVLSRGPGLRPWLARLERLVSEGDVSRAGAGLERWRSLAEQTVAVARQVAEANALPWRRRRELQGLLRATRVKAGAVGRAEDPGVRAGWAGGGHWPSL